MKLSLNWIRDYVDLPQDMDLKRLAYDLTMSTVEVEDAEDLARRFDHMIVGVVQEVCQHPNADKLKVCRTDIGGGDIREIVCGGVNLREGMKVAVACPGAMCRWHGEGEPVEIKETKLRGVASYGMICASSEIGLADLFPAEEAVILDLSDFDAPAGTPLSTALGMDDILLEIDNKSMTNRPDLWGHYGIARELAALYHLPLKPFKHFDRNVENTSGFHVTVLDEERCPRMTGTQIEGLYVKPAPYWMQSRIWKVGMRPINALVDVTNYVMLATGQPSHAYDSDHIAGHIIVRRAEEGEELTTLDGNVRKLTANHLVIADEHRAVGLAGIMGGLNSEIVADTTDVVFESACFDGTCIRKGALSLGMRTEASAKFEKGLDPNTAMEAIDKIRDTSTSHERCSIIEVMGRRAGYIALWCGIANGAEDILLPERYDGNEQYLINRIIENRKRGKKHHIIINAEGIGHSTSMARRIEAATGIETRATIIGHIQRGGTPTCKDRVYASIMGAKAAELLWEGKSNRIVAYRGGRFVDYDIQEALNMTKDISEEQFEISKLLVR